MFGMLTNLIYGVNNHNFIMPDSLMNSISRSTWSHVFQVQIPDPVSEAFIISFIVLLVATLAKYIIAKEDHIKEWGEILIELPIDVCAIVATIIASTQFPETVNVAKYAYSAVLPIFFCAYFRQLTYRLFKQKNNWMYGSAALDILIAAIWILLVINLIAKHYVS